jgi:1-acyl-sn-glycerol-3-phosphate acyltransferase
VGAWLLVAVIPVSLLVLATASFALPWKLRLLRILGFALVYITVEVVGITVAFGSWLASGFGWGITRPAFVSFHYRMLRTCLSVLFWFGSRYFELTVRGDGPVLPGDDGDPTTVEHPLLVMSRHAGPGDSFLLVHELLSWAGRRPRIVLKDTLQWDPLIDLLLNRLPMSFVGPSQPPGAAVGAIGELAGSMRASDALVIFPEGGNVTPGRRRRAIERLRSSGRHAAAERAERIVHLMPPRPGGVQAALQSNPDLHVVVVAHTGLDTLDSLGDIWRDLPVSKTLRLRWHAVPATEVPRDLDGLTDWLFEEWERMDQWVAAQQGQPGRQGAPPAAGAPGGRTGPQQEGLDAARRHGSARRGPTGADGALPSPRATA